LKSERKSNESAKLKKISILGIFNRNKFDKFRNDDFLCEASIPQKAEVRDTKEQTMAF
jgi:hypothetical protein